MEREDHNGHLNQTFRCFFGKPYALKGFTTSLVTIRQIFGDLFDSAFSVF
ncbi:hypothetical protein [Azospirillum palustre]